MTTAMLTAPAAVSIAVKLLRVGGRRVGSYRQTSLPLSGTLPLTALNCQS